MIQKKVLIVDDDSNLLDLMRVVIGAIGVEVFTALDSKTGWELFQKEQPQLVFVDWVMEPLSGHELGIKIKTQNPQVKVVAITGMSDDRKREAAQASGFEGFIDKPFNMDDMLGLVDRLIG